MPDDRKTEGATGGRWTLLRAACLDALDIYDRYCLHDYRVDLFDLGKRLEAVRAVLNAPESGKAEARTCMRCGCVLDGSPCSDAGPCVPAHEPGKAEAKAEPPAWFREMYAKYVPSPPEPQGAQGPMCIYGCGQLALRGSTWCGTPCPGSIGGARPAHESQDEGDADDGNTALRRKVAALETKLAEARAKLARYEAAIKAANLRMASDLYDQPTIWCNHCGRDSGFHWSTCKYRFDPSRPAPEPPNPAAAGEEKR